MEHYSLLNLALEEFAHYITDIFIRLLQLSQKLLVDDFITYHLQPTCTFLKNQIENNLPSNLTNKVTEIVLKLMVKVLNHLEYYNIHQKDEDTINFIIEIAVQVACAASHHSVSSFRSPKITEYYTNLQIYDFIGLYIEEMLKKTQDFKELHLVKIRLSGSIPPLNKLEYWISQSTTDEILSILAESNKTLKHLDFSGSYCGLSDKSVDNILKFHNLRYLKLIYTSISIKGIEKLIRGHEISEDNFKRNLTYLGLIIQPSYVYLIPESLPQLTMLNLHLLSFIDLTPLKELKFLTCLTVTTRMDHSMFSCVENLIQEIGHRLLELKLEMDYLDLKMISECCPILTKFSLKCSFGLSEYIPLKFESVHDLEVGILQNPLSEFLPYFIAQFLNLKKLKLWLQCNPQEGHPSIEILLHPLKTGHFEEVTLVSQFNCITAKFCGECVVLMSDLGYYITVGISELEEVMIQAFQKGIQNLDRKSRLISG